MLFMSLSFYVKALNGAGLAASVSSGAMIVDRTPPLPGSVLDGTKNTTQADKDAQVFALS